MRGQGHRYRVAFVALALACGVVEPSAQPSAPPAGVPAAAAASRGSSTCDGGVALDDGSAETGYGWVPSVVEGEYVQRFLFGQFPNRRLESVCICWLRTQADSDLDFEVVFYDDVGGRPAEAPYAVVPASASIAAMGVVETFFEVDVTGVTIPVGPSYVGARWDPSTDPFFFVCADTSAATEPVGVFFRDDRAEGEWASVFETTDPIFANHRAMMIRGRSSLGTVLDVPGLGVGGLVALAILLAGAAVVTSQRQR